MSTLALHSALYKEHQGTDYLSRTFQSNEVHTPKNTNRGTIDEDCFQRHRSSVPVTPKTPWGRSFSYGGLGPLNLPADHTSKWEPPPRVEKGHQHYGGGVSPHPRGMTIQQYYTKSPLQRSHVRSTDELVPPPTKEYLGSIQITKKFPAEHPYASHISKFALFPSYDSPDDTNKGRPAIASQPTLPAAAPASAPAATIIGKTKGTPARHEVVQSMSSADKEPRAWPEGPNYFQLLKGPQLTRQVYYPNPPSTATPKMQSRSSDLFLTPKSAISLQNLIKSQWTTSYQAAYSRKPFKSENWTNVGTGPSSSGGRITGSSANGHNHVMQERNQSPRSHSLPTNSPAGVDETRNFSRSYSNTSLASTRSARSVQFNGSVRFSDGRSEKEIPLNVNNKENGLRSQSAPKAPFPSSRTIHKSSRSQSASFPVYSIHTLPSQARSAETNSTLESHLEQKRISPERTEGSKTESETGHAIHRPWSKTSAHRAFNENFPERTPDLRRKPDRRITTNERRHIIPEAQAHAYYLH